MGALMYQRWESLLFLHWEYDPAALASILPPGLQVDLFEGKAYLGIIPFRMRGVRPRGLPAVPGLSHFLESNVRTYVRDAQGVPGVWFTSLECSQPLAVWIARLGFHLPYVHATMRREEREGWTHYQTRRRGSKETAAFRYRGHGVAQAAAPDSLEFFLLERYRLYAWNKRSRTLLRGRVSHACYRHRPVEVAEFSTLPARLDGFTLEGPPRHACLTENVVVQIHGIEPVTGKTGLGTQKESRAT